MNASKHVPRFIPTLTEVVDPATVKSVVERNRHDVQALVQQVQSELQPQLERMMQEELAQLQIQFIQEQWQTLHQRLQQEVEKMVQQAVVSCLGATGESKAERSVP